MKHPFIQQVTVFANVSRFIILTKGPFIIVKLKRFKTV